MSVNREYTVEFSDPYCRFCREERNYSAILYAALCRPANMMKFVAMCGVTVEDGAPEPAPYYEFAYLRDWWNSATPEQRKKLLLRSLPTAYGAPVRDALERIPPDFKEANKLLGVAGTASRSYLQSPGRWAVANFAERAGPNLREICMFKWAFNIKPDLVVDLGGRSAICVEAKVCSGEGRYPSSSSEKGIFSRAAAESVGQIRLQKYMMEEILGLKTYHVYLNRSGEAGRESGDPEVGHVVALSWANVFASMDTGGFPSSVEAMINMVSGRSGSGDICAGAHRE